jgi:hypothetical protein
MLMIPGPYSSILRVEAKTSPTGTPGVRFFLVEDPTVEEEARTRIAQWDALSEAEHKAHPGRKPEPAGAPFLTVRVGDEFPAFAVDYIGQVEDLVFLRVQMPTDGWDGLLSALGGL